MLRVHHQSEIHECLLTDCCVIEILIEVVHDWIVCGGISLHAHTIGNCCTSLAGVVCQKPLFMILCMLASLAPRWSPNTSTRASTSWTCSSSSIHPIFDRAASFVDAEATVIRTSVALSAGFLGDDLIRGLGYRESLTRLCVGESVTDKGVAALVSGTPQLKTLELRDCCRLSADGVRALAGARGEILG